MLPVVVSIIFYVLESKTRFEELDYIKKQIIIGIVFGCVAIYGTENGVDVFGATANARDAAPVCAGLIFGAPAGIIAGFIGGIERWFAVYWGAGTYTRLACTLGTINAGLMAAVARKFIFKNKLCTWDVAGLIALFVEAVHLSLAFLTNLNDAEHAFQVISALTVPMLSLNTIAVVLAFTCIRILQKKLPD